ncbi:MAG: hypothetical protein IJI77_05685 [Erysipelotrichaceae bacterium]|nr:hypothetical protein [Erysipelotrichaceae bacterium]
MTLRRCLIVFLLFCLMGCRNSEESSYYKDKLTSYRFAENTYVLLEKEDSKAADIGMVANGDLALISIRNDAYQIDQYYIDTVEYCYLKGPDTPETYYKVNISRMFEDPMDIYKKMVLDPTDIAGVEYLETVNENGRQLDHIKGKISNRETHFYWNKETDDLEKIVFHDGSVLLIEHRDLTLPEEFDQAIETDTDTINAFMKEFTDSINE